MCNLCILDINPHNKIAVAEYLIRKNQEQQDLLNRDLQRLALERLKLVAALNDLKAK